MPKRTVPNAVQTMSDLSDLAQIVVDKRNSKRSSAKKSRRNRHYENQLIRNALSQGMGSGTANLSANDLDETYAPDGL
jgi:hypothetical protein